MLPGTLALYKHNPGQKYLIFLCLRMLFNFSSFKIMQFFSRINLKYLKTLLSMKFSFIEN